LYVSIYYFYKGTRNSKQTNLRIRAGSPERVTKTLLPKLRLLPVTDIVVPPEQGPFTGTQLVTAESLKHYIQANVKFSIERKGKKQQLNTRDLVKCY